MFSFQLPIQHGLDLFPRTMQAPPVERIIVEYPSLPADTDYPKWQAQRQAEEMLRPLVGQIRGFVHGQRRVHSLGVIDYSWKRTSFPGVVINWRSMAGQETIEIRVRPVPPTKREDDLMLLILHDGNKVTAVPMRQIADLAGAATEFQIGLTNSSWGSEIIRASQYKFSAGEHSVILSGLVIVDGVLSRGEQHYITHTLSEIKHFVGTSAEATDAPIINGDGTTFYTPFGIYALESSDAGLRLVDTGPAYHPIPAYAISATGEYYYAPSARVFRCAGAPANPREATILPPYYTYAEYDAFVESGSLGGFAVTFAFMTEGEIDAFLDSPEFYDGTTDWDAVTGYRIDHPAQSAPVFNYSTLSSNTSSTVKSDVSTMFPVSVFSQDAATQTDTVEVQLTPLDAYINRWTNPEDGLDFTVDAYVSVLGRRFDMYSSATVNSGDFGAPFYRFWYTPHPPCFSTTTGDFYLGESEHVFPDITSSATLHTPFGGYTIEPHPDMNFRFGMFDRYKPWLHISNGAHYIQGFELDGIRRLFSAGQEVTTDIERLTGTAIANVQMLLMDIPLKRIKEFT